MKSIITRKELPISEIVGSAYYYRLGTEQNTDLSFQMLRNSIEADGVLHPIRVKETRDGKYKIVYGNRRLAAVRELGLKTIPADIVEKIDNLSIRVQPGSENEGRLRRSDEEKGLWLIDVYVTAGYEVKDVIRLLTVLNTREYLERKKVLLRAHVTNNVLEEDEESGRPGRPRVNVPDGFIKLANRIPIYKADQQFLILYSAIVPKEIRSIAEEKELSLQKKYLLANPEIVAEPVAAKWLIDKMSKSTYTKSKKWRDKTLEDLRAGNVYVKDPITGKTIRMPKAGEEEEEEEEDHIDALRELEDSVNTLFDALSGINESNCDADKIEDTRDYRLRLVKRIDDKDFIVQYNWMHAAKRMLEDWISILDEEKESRSLKSDLLRP